MSLSQEQIEQIINEVVRRVLAALNGDAGVASNGGSLAIESRLVTLETLRGRLESVSRVEVKRKAVVTPAVIDLLKERSISLARTLK